MARMFLRVVDRQASNVVRGLTYILLVCILVLAADVLLLRYSRANHPSQFPGYDVSRHRARLNVDVDDSRSLMKPMRHQVQSGNPLPSVAVPIDKDYYRSSNVTCRKGYSRSRFKALFGNKFDPDIPLFVGPDFLDRPNAVNLPIPFGFRDSESTVMNILKYMPKTGLPDNLPQKSCLRCVVQGNGGIVSRTRLGEVINNYDLVFRLNSAPIVTHEQDVGNKTTLRMAYPESAFRRPEQYEEGWTFVVMVFKSLDLTWLETIIRGRQMNSGSGFWKKIPLSIPKPTKDFRIFNPEILQEAANIMGFKLNKGKADRNVPTSGIVALMMSLRICDEVALSGFGYDPNRPSAPLHYYDSMPMREIWKSWTHDIHQERGFLRLLTQQGVITDLSGGIR